MSGTTVSIRFLTLVHYGVYADAASVCLTLTALAGAAAGVMAFLLRRSLRREAA